MSASSRTSLGRSFKQHWFAVLFLFLLSSLFYVVSLVLPAADFPFLHELTAHLAIAFAVAIVILLSVEMQSRARAMQELEEYRSEVSRGVWQALCARSLPSQVVSEIDSLMKGRVSKEDCRYTLTFKRPYTGAPPGTIVIERRAVYRLRNLMKSEVHWPTKGRIVNDFPEQKHDVEGGKTFTVPRHTSFTIDGKDFLDQALLDRDGARRTLEFNVRLAPEASVEVFMATEEMFRLRDTSFYLEMTMSAGLTLVLRNEARDLITEPYVLLLHPAWERFKPGPDDIYRFEGALFPGQGFLVHWSEVQKN